MSFNIFRKKKNKQEIYNEVLSTSLIERVFSPTYSRDKTYFTNHCISSCVYLWTMDKLPSDFEVRFERDGFFIAKNLLSADVVEAVKRGAGW